MPLAEVTCPNCGRVLYSNTSLAQVRRSRQRHVRNGCRTNVQISPQVVDRVHRDWPSTTWEWDAAMVDRCRRPIVALVADKLDRWQQRKAGRILG